MNLFSTPFETLSIIILELLWFDCPYLEWFNEAAGLNSDYDYSYAYDYLEFPS